MALERQEPFQTFLVSRFTVPWHRAYHRFLRIINSIFICLGLYESFQHLLFGRYVEIIAKSSFKVSNLLTPFGRSKPVTHDPAYRQLLTLIGARSQQWLRSRIDQLPVAADLGDNFADDVTEIAVAAYICSGLRGTPVPLQQFISNRFKSRIIPNPKAGFSRDSGSADWRSARLFKGLTDVDPTPALSGASMFPADRASLVRPLEAALLAEAEEMLRTPIPEERLTDQAIDTYASVLALCYCFGMERPRFASARTYGDAFSNCLRFANWAERKGRLMPLAQMCYCLCLIDPDHDVAPMLADIISSQRPDGSFPARIGFGTADQDNSALRPTLAALVALHMAIYRRWHGSQPNLPIAA